MKSIIARYLNSWWLPTLACFGLQVIAGVAFFFSGTWFIYTLDDPWPTLFNIVTNIVVLLYGLSLMVLLFAAIRHLFKRQWLKGVLVAGLFAVSVGITVIIFVAGVFMFSMIELSAPSEDGFADELVIPNDIEFALPVDMPDIHTFPDTPNSPEQAAMILYEDFQPGLYGARIWANPGEAGSIYLKAFEVTQNTPLSTSALKERTMTAIDGSGDLGELTLNEVLFTIYEGDWGKPYGARFEVWFTPDVGGPDRMLFETYYIIEGWQR